MTIVKKVRGGRYYHRQTGSLTIGDESDVSEEMAAYLCDERGGFKRVGDSDPGAPPVIAEEATVTQIEDAIAEVESADAVRYVLENELEGRARTTAINALEQRLEELED